MKNHGHDRVIINISEHTEISLKYASAALALGMEINYVLVPGYASIPNPEALVKPALAFIKSNNLPQTGSLFINLSYTNPWGFTSSNMQAITSIVQLLKEGYPGPVGIQSISKAWDTITRNTDAFKALPLYQTCSIGHCDEKPDVNTPFTPYGGWIKPTYKMYDTGERYRDCDLMGLTVFAY